MPFDVDISDYEKARLLFLINDDTYEMKSFSHSEYLV